MRCVLSVCHGPRGLLVVRALVTDILDPLEQIESAPRLKKYNHIDLHEGGILRSVLTC